MRRIDHDPCLQKAMNDEPSFILLARDPMMPALVTLWCAMRRLEIANGTRPGSDLVQVEAAERAAHEAKVWRIDADESWRKQHVLPLGEEALVCGASSSGPTTAR